MIDTFIELDATLNKKLIFWGLYYKTWQRDLQENILRIYGKLACFLNTNFNYDYGWTS